MLLKCLLLLRLLLLLAWFCKNVTGRNEPYLLILKPGYYGKHTEPATR